MVKRPSDNGGPNNLVPACAMAPRNSGCCKCTSRVASKNLTDRSQNSPEMEELELGDEDNAHFVEEADEISSLIARVVESNGDAAGAVYSRYRTIVGDPGSQFSACMAPMLAPPLARSSTSTRSSRSCWTPTWRASCYRCQTCCVRKQSR